MKMDEDDVEKAKTRKRSCCNKWICNIIILVFVVVFIVAVCIVTFVDKDVRSVEKYDPSKLEWWQKSIIYQIYPRSFQDSDGDGVGDIRGIINRLDHFTYLGIEAIWISPFYLSPMKDFGYDVQNFTDIDPLFGNMTDFDELLRKATEKGLKIIMDFVPNHSSNESQWFVESKNRDPEYRDYYVWINGSGSINNCTHEPQPPNNWMSVFGGSAWQWEESRNQFYYHAFLKEQPDLNYKNERVVKEMQVIPVDTWTNLHQNVLRFWCKKGVAGFRLDALKNLMEVDDVTMNETDILPIYIKDTCKYNLYDGHNPHNLTTNLPGMFDVINGWKDVLDECEKEDKIQRFMIAESYGVSPELRDKYIKAGAIPFDFGLIEETNKMCGGNCIKDVIRGSLEGLPEDNWPLFVLGNHDRPRVAERFGKEMIDAFNMLLLTLPGTPTTYYGEEIGMEDVEYSFNETRDPAGLNYGKEGYKNASRDPERSPMQWNNSTNAGFTTSNNPWLHLSQSYTEGVNVEQEKKNHSSHLVLYKNLAKLRRYVGFQTNRLEFATTNENIISYTRYAIGWDKHLVVLNLGSSKDTVDVSAAPVGSSTGTIVLSTNNFPDGEMAIDKNIDLRKITLDRGQGLVIKVTH